MNINYLKNKNNSNRGYIALSTVLITLALVLLIGVSSSLLSINDLLSADSGKKSNQTIDLVDACIEEALLQINEENTIDTQITLPEGICSVTINSNAGGAWDFNVSANSENYFKTVRVGATRTTGVTVNTWLEE